jgi:integrase
MASILRRPSSRYYLACFRDSKGVQHRRSTKETDRKKAAKVAEVFEKMAAGKSKRHALQASIDQLYRDLYDESLPHATVREYADAWLAVKQPEVSVNTQEIYRNCVKKLFTFLGPDADRDISEIDRRQLIAFRNDACSRVGSATVNQYVGVVKQLFRSALKDEFISCDPTEFIEGVRRTSSDGPLRRAFTVPEVQRMIEAADDEWRSLIKFGLYTGQRLGDLALLTRSNLEEDVIRLRALKTGKQLTIPICPALRSHIAGAFPSSDSPKAPLHPRAFKIAITQNGVCNVSHGFARILKAVGLRQENPHGQAKGRAGRRTRYELSFHSLRHTFVSLLKHGGASQAAVMELAGHDSEQMSSLYTHSSVAELTRAIALLPEVRS